jgi:hypothetical protein
LSGSIFNRIIIIVILLTLLVSCDQAPTSKNEYAPRWQKYVDTNPVDGSKDVQMLIGTTERPVSQTGNVILVLTCKQGVTSAYVVWRQYLGAYDPEITWRIGTDPSITETWSLSMDSEATFAPEPVALIKQMMTNDSFLIKAAPMEKPPVTVEFNTAGLSTEIHELRKACTW